MKQFDFYEFTGILLPGAMLLAGVVLLWPEVSKMDGFKDISVGGMGIFVLLSYIAGHLVQAFGNMLEWIWWKAFGGMPTDWIRSRGDLLTPAQIQRLQQKLQERLGINSPDKLSKFTAEDWYGLTRQMYAAVAAAGRAARVDTFNGNYGLNRGLLAASLLVAGIAFFSAKVSDVLTTAFVAFALLAASRMHRFGKHYARELFVQFLQLPPGDASKEKNQ